MRILFTGGSGFLGTHLIQRLKSKGHEILNLSRKVGVAKDAKNIVWDGKRIPDEAGPVDVIINLAGASIADSRWTDKYKKLLIDSRVHATKACVDFIKRQEAKPKVFLSSSGINFFGADSSFDLDEDSAPGDDFMAGICKEWEAVSKGSGVRTVQLRTPVVLAKEGGALSRMLTPFKFFVGGPLGNGKQGFPWIHVDDFVGIVEWIVENEKISGPVNMVAPQVITNREFSKALGKAMKRPSFFRLPKAILKLMFGEMSIVLWGGVKARSKVLENSDYKFIYPDIEKALKACVK